MSCIRQRAATTQSPEPLKDKAAKPWLLVEQRVKCLIEGARSRPSAMPHEVVLPAGGSIVTLTGSSIYLASLPFVRTIRAKRGVAIPAGIWNFIAEAAGQ